ncbi:alkene reductase [Sulfitobacter sp. S190]|uniref:alkene reductase n=1 Tax=Sulfitobacter sp. S190 TaxID=2867022 RepID=UPI0021A8F3A0|nr:alkene reductase [Sulfitobacter sp. S190]UWR23235.1 alkene reductase [Sulfitobacter sp. S190]
MTHHASLFTPVRMGDVTLPNRVLMAPLTRNRAGGDGVPSDMAVTYYAQRASAGMILTEATQVSAMGKGYIDTPGIYTEDHVAGWRKITDAVHAAGGRIYCQLWHVGRISHTSLLPDNAAPVSSTDVAADAQTFTQNGFEDTSKPTALDAEGIKQTIADFAHAAKCAQEAGFDGVEVHAANGYLIDQFLQDGVNKRDDAYGGSLENRMRLLAEILDEVIDVFGAGRVGVRLSPIGEVHDMSDSDPEKHFGEIYKALDARGLAYLHIVEKFPGSEGEKDLVAALRPHFTGFYMANGDYDGATAAKVIDSGHAHGVTFGRPFIANPDLPERIRRDAEMNTPDQDTFYGGGREGYTDYPFLDTPPA